MADACNVLEPIEGGRKHKIADQRESPHFPYVTQIYVAPCPGTLDLGLRDVLANMFPAEGFDLSQGGVSFYLQESPESKHFLIRLGEMPEAILLLCEVNRTEEGYWNRKRQYRVVCQFLERVPFGKTTPTASP